MEPAEPASEVKTFWPDLTHYRLACWIEALPGTEPRQYRFRLASIGAMTPEDEAHLRETLIPLVSDIGATLHGDGRDGVFASWTGLRVPKSPAFLQYFPGCVIRPLDSLARGPWWKDRPKAGSAAQWFWRVLDAPVERLGSVPGRYGEAPYELWTDSPERAARYSERYEPVTRKDLEAVAPLCAESRNGGLWVLPVAAGMRADPKDAESVPPPMPATRPSEREDYGEKVGGARKDRASGAVMRTLGEWNVLARDLSDMHLLREALRRVRRDDYWIPDRGGAWGAASDPGAVDAALVRLFTEALRREIAASAISLPWLSKRRHRYYSPDLAGASLAASAHLYPQIVREVKARLDACATVEDLARVLDAPADPVSSTAIRALQSLLRAEEPDGQDPRPPEDLLHAASLPGLVSLLDPHPSSTGTLWRKAWRGFWLHPAFAPQGLISLACAEEERREFLESHYLGSGWVGEHLVLLRARLRANGRDEAMLGLLGGGAAQPESTATATAAASEAAAHGHDPMIGTGVPKRLIPSPRFEKLERHGPAWRTGHITEQRLAQTFGLRAVEYGNWVKDADRQAMLDLSFDSFCDLARALDVPTEAVGFHGHLALALGARGRGGNAAAHYEPDRKVINLTKTMGAGTLAHEWSHALDHWIAYREHPATPVLATNHQGIRDAALAAPLSGFMGAVCNAAGRTSSEEFVRRLIEDALLDKTLRIALPGAAKAASGWVRDELIPEVCAGNADPAVFAGQFCKREDHTWIYSPVHPVARCQDYAQRHPETGEWSAETEKTLRDFFLYASRTTPCFTYQSFHRLWKDLHEIRRLSCYTTFHRNALTLDARRADPYWSAPHELFARAFSAVLHDRLGQCGIRNDFASRFSAPDEFSDSRWRASPNPEGEERKDFLQASLPLFHAVREALRVSPAPGDGAVEEEQPSCAPTD